MAEDQLRTLIDAVRTRLNEELEVQLGAMAETQARTVEQARVAAEEAAERRSAALLESARAEWKAQLQTEVQSAVASARTEAEQVLAAEVGRARVEAEQAAMETAAAARRQLEDSFAVERQHLQAQLDAERRRISELEADRERTAAAIDTQQQRVSELESERERVAADLASARQEATAQLESERQRAAGELQAAREQAEAVLEAERQRGAQALSDARTAREAEPLQAPPPATSPDAVHRLADAMQVLDEAATLTDLLASVVRSAAAEAPRAAMFLIQGTELREWPVAGVRSVDAGPLRADGREAGVIAEALRRTQPAATGGAGESAAPHFAALPAGGIAVAVPLVLGRVPVAVLYADQGSEGKKHGAWPQAVEILGRHAAARAASLTAVRTAQAMRLVGGDSSVSGSPASDTSHDDVQAARRYARLLVSEIKLYNESAVRMGRERRDLLLRLEPEIERARRLYYDKVAASVSARDAVFSQELAQTLADGDHSLLGAPGHQQSSC